jgi:formylglycine-generating enzyme required for sulfatase activity
MAQRRRAQVDTLEGLLDGARAVSSNGADAAAEVARLYQGEAAGANPECANQSYGVYDLVGNVEEWTLRADDQASGDFLGNLKGRYWAESRTCQGNVRVHGNGFRFYEIGFRCCMDP